MIKESMQSEEEKEEVKRLSFAVLMMQGIATSIDALSVGFTTAGYDLVMAVVCSLIVAVVTFVICETGLCSVRLWEQSCQERQMFWEV